MLSTLVATMLGFACIDKAQIEAIRFEERRNSAESMWLSTQKGCFPISTTDRVTVIHRQTDANGERWLQIRYEDRQLWTNEVYFDPRPREPSPQIRTTRDPRRENADRIRKQMDATGRWIDNH